VTLHRFSREAADGLLKVVMAVAIPTAGILFSQRIAIGIQRIVE
jgi:hypothetical protein